MGVAKVHGGTIAGSFLSFRTFPGAQVVRSAEPVKEFQKAVRPVACRVTGCDATPSVHIRGETMHQNQRFASAADEIRKGPTLDFQSFRV